MRTVSEPASGSEVRVEPSDTDGITINGIPVTLDNAVTVFRVDLVEDDTRTFIVEHVLSVMGMYGVTAAEITGIRTEWDFARPEHRFCYSADLSPEYVVGHPAGLQNPALVEALRTIDIIENRTKPRKTVSEPVEYGDGAIRLQPRGYGEGILFRNHYEKGTISFEIDPQSRSDLSKIELINTSTTPFLTPTPREAAIHWIGDMVSDIGVIGGFDDLVVDSYDAGHGATIGVSRKAYKKGLVVKREV
jgi:hypothetical protein